MEGLLQLGGVDRHMQVGLSREQRSDAHRPAHPILDAGESGNDASFLASESTSEKDRLQRRGGPPSAVYRRSSSIQSALGYLAVSGPANLSINRSKHERRPSTSGFRFVLCKAKCPRGESDQTCDAWCGSGSGSG